MILYHVSRIAVDKPDLLHSRRDADFGVGFYTIDSLEQAVAWGQRYIRFGMDGIISVYELDDSVFTKCRFRNFPDYNEEWFDFVFACRNCADNTDYDLIQGGYSNDFSVWELYRQRRITRETALERLRCEKPNPQQCFKTQETIDRYLHFLKSEKL